jgi:hypothetical protein
MERGRLKDDRGGSSRANQIIEQPSAGEIQKRNRLFPCYRGKVFQKCAEGITRFDVVEE